MEPGESLEAPRWISARPRADIPDVYHRPRLLNLHGCSSEMMDSASHRRRSLPRTAKRMYYREPELGTQPTGTICSSSCLLHGGMYLLIRRTGEALTGPAPRSLRRRTVEPGLARDNQLRRFRAPARSDVIWSTFTCRHGGDSPASVPWRERDSGAANRGPTPTYGEEWQAQTNLFEPLGTSCSDGAPQGAAGRIVFVRRSILSPPTTPSPTTPSPTSRRRPRREGGDRRADRGADAAVSLETAASMWVRAQMTRRRRGARRRRRCRRRGRLGLPTPASISPPSTYFSRLPGRSAGVGGGTLTSRKDPTEKIKVSKLPWYHDYPNAAEGRRRWSRILPACMPKCAADVDWLCLAGLATRCRRLGARTTRRSEL